MEEFRPFNEVTFGLSTQYDTEVIGTRIGAIGFSMDLVMTGTAVTPKDDAAFRLAGTPEVVQGNQPLIRMTGPSWRHISAMSAGGYDDHRGGTASPNLAQCILDLDSIMPGAMINGAGSARTGSVKVFFRGTFGSLLDYGPSGNTAHVGVLRPFVTTSPFDPDGGFLRPSFREFNVDLSANSADIQHKVDFDEDTLVVGLFHRTEDASAAPAGENVDGLVKKIRVDVNRGVGGQMELARYTWGQARLLLAHRAGYTGADILNSVGCVMIPLIDRANNSRGNASLLRKGDSLTMHYDTLAASEHQFADVTPGAGDFATVTILGFTLVAGAGDQGAASVIRTGVTPNARNRRRLKRRTGR